MKFGKDPLIKVHEEERHNIFVSFLVKISNIVSLLGCLMLNKIFLKILLEVKPGKFCFIVKKRSQDPRKRLRWRAL